MDDIDAQTEASHPVGQCFDGLYGQDCNGIATWGEDPFAADIYDDPTPVWMCEGVRYGRLQDI